MKYPLIIVCLLLAGCGYRVQKVDEPAALLPVGAGVQGQSSQNPLLLEGGVFGGGTNASEFPASASRSLWNDRGAQMFRDRRASSLGDIVTVLIDVDDRAALSSLSNRSRNGSATLGIDASVDSFGITGEGNVGLNASGQTKASGEGTVRRSERIELSVAALVTGVLPNGNLLISGLQEIRVSNEKRSLGVQGIIRPKDISPDNTVRYDQLAEARVSYGGGGRIADMQQPALVHQIYDQVAPF